MSRVGKKVIPIPEKVKILYKDRLITVQGEKGKLSRTIHPAVELEIDEKTIKVVVIGKQKDSSAIQGLTRSLVANMITGIDKGFERVLKINGIGYRADVQGKNIVFNIGYSNPVNFAIPEGLSVSIDKNNVIRLTGIDKEKLGVAAASIRSLRPPEPYKGKGIKYAEEYIMRKAGKTGTK
ncbi:MAG: 50S ribosomal protein L6 [Desulfobacteraceae bacterium 4572_123]|nr:MAG: 50S ribosomal protein L6 [Desulfobacteraceae bacterium 4572_123]